MHLSGVALSYAKVYHPVTHKIDFSSDSGPPGPHHLLQDLQKHVEGHDVALDAEQAEHHHSSMDHGRYHVIGNLTDVDANNF